jgi:hypothetical protein
MDYLQRHAEAWQALGEHTARLARQGDEGGAAAQAKVRDALQPLLAAAGIEVLRSLYGRGPADAAHRSAPAAQSPA